MLGVVKISGVTKPHSGPSVARNVGFEQARADCIYALDSDDLIEPATLEKCFWFLQSHPEYDFVNGFSVGFGAKEYLWTKGYHDREEFPLQLGEPHLWRYHEEPQAHEGPEYEQAYRHGKRLVIGCRSFGSWCRSAGV